MQNLNKPLFLNPAWLAQIGAIAPKAGFIVYGVNYPDNGGNRTLRQWSHNTLKAAHRRLGSVCRGKLAKRDEHSAFIMTPAGDILNWYESKRLIG